MSLIQLPLILLLSCVVFGDKIDLISLAGCLVIIVSSAFVVLSKTGGRTPNEAASDSGEYAPVREEVITARKSISLEEKMDQTSHGRRSFAATEA